jgi:hypothetical protein
VPVYKERPPSRGQGAEQHLFRHQDIPYCATCDSTWSWWSPSMPGFDPWLNRIDFTGFYGGVAA